MASQINVRFEGVCDHAATVARGFTAAEEADVRVRADVCGGDTALVGDEWLVVAVNFLVDRLASFSFASARVVRVAGDSVAGGWKSRGWLRVATITAV